MAQLSWSSLGEEALRYRINLDRGRIRMRTGILVDDSERKERHIVYIERERLRITDEVAEAIMREI